MFQIQVLFIIRRHVCTRSIRYVSCIQMHLLVFIIKYTAMHGPQNVKFISLLKLRALVTIIYIRA